MKIEVFYFGLIEEALGKNKETVAIASNTSLKKLKEFLLKKHCLLQQTTFNLAVNKKIEPLEVLLNEGDEIALLPPFAGG